MYDLLLNTSESLIINVFLLVSSKMSFIYLRLKIQYIYAHLNMRVFLWRPTTKDKIYASAYIEHNF